MSFQQGIRIFFLCVVFLSATLAQASPRKGFYKGPYLTLNGGFMTFDWDVNQRTQIEEADSLEPIIGLGFGWNLNDWFAPEMVVRYTTSANSGRREHIIASHLGIVFTARIQSLVDSEKFRILPFVKGGSVIQVAVLPGDQNAQDTRITSKGLGMSVGGGIRFLWNQYIYFGVEGDEAFIFHEGQIQNLNPGGNTVIYDGGWKKQFEFLTMIGIHY